MCRNLFFASAKGRVVFHGGHNSPEKMPGAAGRAESADKKGKVPTNLDIHKAVPEGFPVDYKPGQKITYESGKKLNPEDFGINPKDIPKSQDDFVEILKGETERSKKMALYVTSSYPFWGSHKDIVKGGVPDWKYLPLALIPRYEKAGKKGDWATQEIMLQDNAGYIKTCRANDIAAAQRHHPCYYTDLVIPESHYEPGELDMSKQLQDKSVFVVGAGLAKGVAAQLAMGGDVKEENVKHVAASTPSAALAQLKTMKIKSPAFAFFAFDSAMFADGDADQMLRETRDLLQYCRDNGVIAGMSTLLKTGAPVSVRSPYFAGICRLEWEGLIPAGLSDIGSTAENLRKGTEVREDFLTDGEPNERCASTAANGFRVGALRYSGIRAGRTTADRGDSMHTKNEHVSQNRSVGSASASKPSMSLSESVTGQVAVKTSSSPEQKEEYRHLITPQDMLTFTYQRALAGSIPSEPELQEVFKDMENSIVALEAENQPTAEQRYLFAKNKAAIYTAIAETRVKEAEKNPSSQSKRDAKMALEKAKNEDPYNLKVAKRRKLEGKLT